MEHILLEAVEKMTNVVKSDTPEHIQAVPSTKQVLRNVWFQASKDKLVSSDDKYVYHVAR